LGSNGLFALADENENYKKGLSAYTAKDYATAKTYWEKGIEEGSSEAMRKLGYLYSKGWGVERDDRKAVELYEQAATAGHPDAPYILGYKYREMKEYASAKKWYLKAMEKEGPLGVTAMVELGEMYEAGEGVPQDYERAFMLYLSARSTLSSTHFRMSRLYMEGKGVHQHPGMAYKWLKKATNYEPAKEALAKFDGIPKITEEEKQALKQAEELADTDPEQAFPFYLKAAEAGHWKALVAVAKGYLKGVGVAQDDVQARKWLKRAAEVDDPESMKLYADMLREGKGGPANGEYAKIWYERAMHHQYWPALYELGVMNDGGHGIPKNEEKAAYWYRRSAAAGNSKAKEILAARGLPEKIAKPTPQTTAQTPPAATPRPMSEYEKQQAFIQHINQYGPNTESLSTYSYDVAVYCSWGGKRCGEFQAKKNSYINQHNRNAAAQNAERLRNVYSNRNSYNSRPSSGFTYTQQVTDRYNQNVRQAEEKRKMDEYKRDLHYKIYRHK
jgi:TPR repeat protein